MEVPLEAYYRQYGPMVFRRCRSMLKDEAAAYKATQTVFTTLMTKNTLFNGHPSHFLFRLATNVCLPQIEREMNAPESKGADERDASALEVRKERFATLKRVFDDYDEETRTMAYMRFIDKMSYKDLAEDVGCSVSTVRKRLRTSHAIAKTRATTTKRTPAWMLERILLQELPETKLRNAEVRLAQEDDGEERRTHLSRENEELLTRYPPKEFVASLKKGKADAPHPSRVDRGKGKLPPVFYAIIPLTLAAALLVGIFLLRDSILARFAEQDEYSVTSDVETGETPALPATASEVSTPAIVTNASPLHIYRENGDVREPVTDGERAWKDDILRCSFRPMEYTYAMLFSFDGRGIVTLHFPYSQDDDGHVTNDGEVPLRDAYQLDDAPLYERFFLLRSTAPLPVRDLLDKAKRFAANTNVARTGRLPISKHYEQTSLLLNKGE